jgi:hypothetical protein
MSSYLIAEGSDGQPAALLLDANRNLKVVTTSGGGAGAQEVQGTAAVGAAAVGNPLQLGGIDASGNMQALSVGQGNAAAGTLRVAVASDDVLLTAIKTAVELIDDAVAGSELQVDVVAPLPAGTNAIGKLAANDGVDIGDVSVNSVVPGSAATSLGKAVDDAGNATDVGVAALVLRDDALTTLTPVDGDYVRLRVDSVGALWTRDRILEAALSGSELQVDVVGALPAGSNNIGSVDVASVVPGSGATNLGKAVDVAAGASDVGVASLVVRDDALTTLTPVDGDYVRMRVDSTGALWTRDSVLGAALSGSELQVDIVGALPAGTNNIGDVDVLTLPGTAAEGAALPSVFMVVAGDDGVDTHPLQLDASGNLKMSLEVDNVGIGGGTEYAVDAPLGATPTGTLAIARRDDALSTLTPVEDDAIALRVDSVGALWTRDRILEAALAGSELQVDVVGALPAGTNNIGDVDVLTLIPGTGATNLGKAIDEVAGASDVGVASLAVRDDILSTLTPVDGDWAPFRLDSQGKLWTHDGTLEAALSAGGTEFDVNVVAALPAGTNAIGKLAAGENHVGEVGGKTIVKDVTLTLDTLAYASGDVLADFQEVTGCLRVNDGTAVLQSIVLLDKDDQGGALDLVFANAAGTLGTENAAVSISDADAANILGVVPITASDYVDLVNSKIVILKNVGLGIVSKSAADSIYVGAISRDSKTYTASGITLRLTFLAD